MNYTDLPGYSEKLNEAYRRQEEARIKSLILPRSQLCGIKIKPISIRHLLILTGLGNGFVTGGPTVLDVYEFVWVLSEKKGPFQWFFHRRAMMSWAKKNTPTDPVLRMAEEIENYLDDQTMDLPGKHKSSDGRGIDISSLPRLNTYLDQILEVMSVYPSFTHDYLLNLDLGAFFQILNASRFKNYPEYKTAQPTDLVQQWALNEVRRLNKPS